MATINAVNRKMTDLTIDPGSGDATLQFSINGTAEFTIGVDDDVSDTFKISQGSALGSNDTFVMTSAGERTLPLTSSFEARTTSDDLNVSGDNTVAYITFDTEDFDQNADYDNSTGIFTAPVTGRYLFCWSYTMFIDATGGDVERCDLATSNRTHFGLWRPTKNKVTNLDGENGYMGYSHSAIADMDAADTARVYFLSGNNSKTDDVIAENSTSTNFSGVLIS